MTIATTNMARKNKRPSTHRPADGIVLQANLCRLGYCETVVKATEVSKLVTERTGRPMSRQRIAQLINAVTITEGTLAVLAKGLGVEVDDLIRWEDDNN